jgi:hypothetical protein
MRNLLVVSFIQITSSLQLQELFDIGKNWMCTSVTILKLLEKDLFIVKWQKMTL